jgi:hypothetical protein
MSRNAAIGYTVSFGCVFSELLWLLVIIHIPKAFTDAVFQYSFLTSSIAGSVVITIGVDIFRRRNEKMKPDSTFWDLFFVSLKNLSIIFSALLLLTTYLSNYQHFRSPQKVATVVIICIGEVLWWGMWVLIFGFIKKKGYDVSRIISFYSILVILVGFAWFLKPFIL